MEDLRVAAVATRNWIGEQDRAIRHMAKWARRACAEGAELVVFPELNVSGYFHSTHTLREAEPVPGPSTEKIVRLAGEVGAVLCFGILENDSDVVYNTQVVVNGDGILGAQRKIHMPGEEYMYWRGGFDVRAIDIGKARLGIAICYDAAFSEMARTLYFRGAEVLIMPFAYMTEGPRANLPSTNIGVMTYRVQCNSNGFYGIAVNNAGRRRATKQEGSKASFPGWAGVFDPRGKVVAWTREPGHGQAMVVADLKAKTLYDRRRDRYFVPRCLVPERYATIDEGMSSLPGRTRRRGPAACPDDRCYADGCLTGNLK